MINMRKKRLIKTSPDLWQSPHPATGKTRAAITTRPISPKNGVGKNLYKKYIIKGRNRLTSNMSV
jgi:hypothetical protein